MFKMVKGWATVWTYRYVFLCVKKCIFRRLLDVCWYVGVRHYYSFFYSAEYKYLCNSVGIVNKANLIKNISFWNSLHKE